MPLSILQVVYRICKKPFGPVLYADFTAYLTGTADALELQQGETGYTFAIGDVGERQSRLYEILALGKKLLNSSTRFRINANHSAQKDKDE